MDQRLHFEPVALQFAGDLGEYHHLPRFELDQQGHEQALALNLFDFAGAKEPLKQNALVGDVLVDDPEAVLARGQDEGLAEWPRGLRPAR